MSSTKRLEEQQQINAAPPIDFQSFQSSAEQSQGGRDPNALGQDKSVDDSTEPSMRYARIVPASPSYFTAKPKFTDNYVELQELLRKHQTLPSVTPAAAPRAYWKTLGDYRNQVGEPVMASRYNRVVELLRRLNRIHHSLMPEDVKEALQRHLRDINPLANRPKPGIIDEFGRAVGVGRRKTSRARVWLVEGNGEVLINGISINEVFGRIHDRESALWALKSTARMDKYNVWALVKGGGKTGQAEAITLGLGKALLVHEPDLKAALRLGKLAQFWL